MKTNLFSLLLLLLISFACNSLAIAQCEGDIDGDLDADGSDLRRIILDYGRTNCNNNNPCPADLYGDHAVNEIDLDIFLDGFGRAASAALALSTARVHVTVTDFFGGSPIDGALVSVLYRPDGVSCYPYSGTAPLAFTFCGVPTTPIEISFEASAPDFSAFTKTTTLWTFATVDLEIPLTRFYPCQFK